LVFSFLDGVPLLVSSLLSGTGLRLFEALSPRVEDADCRREEVLVRDGKGQKDRVTMLPAAVRERLRAQPERLRRLHGRDLSQGQGRAPRPDAFARKYPAADREWGWQWVFPASSHYADQRTDIRHRHPIHEAVVQSGRSKKQFAGRDWRRWPSGRLEFPLEQLQPEHLQGAGRARFSGGETMTTINRVALGEKLYFFESPTPAENRCFIWAHGAWLSGDGWFDLENGLSVHYYVAFGENRKTGTRQAIAGPTHTTPQLPPYVYSGPIELRNYTLWKVLDNSDATGDYDTVKDAMKYNQLLVSYHWTPHVVTVRRRLAGKSIQLGDVIGSVRGSYPGITEFYYGCCRGDYSEREIVSALGRMYIALQTSKCR
jgi:hypothetical protein